MHNARAVNETSSTAHAAEKLRANARMTFAQRARLFADKMSGGRELPSFHCFEMGKGGRTVAPGLLGGSPAVHCVTSAGGRGDAARGGLPRWITGTSMR